MARRRWRKRPRACARWIADLVGRLSKSAGPLPCACASRDSRASLRSSSPSRSRSPARVRFSLGWRRAWRRSTRIGCSRPTTRHCADRPVEPKMRAMRALARAVAVEGLDLGALGAMDAADAHRALVAVSGIGPWTADIFLLFCLGHPDAFPAGDLALQEAARLALELDDGPTRGAWRRSRSAGVPGAASRPGCCGPIIVRPSNVPEWRSPTLRGRPPPRRSIRSP